MAESHDNDINFNKGRGITTLGFVYSNEYIVSEGQPFDTKIDVNEKNNKTIITIKAGCHGTKECAEWLKKYVGEDDIHMVHTLGGDSSPDKLNFAIKGQLTINGHKFDVCIGQGHNSSGNNWHIASVSIEADADNKNCEIGDGIRMTQDGSHGFELSTHD